MNKDAKANRSDRMRVPEKESNRDLNDLFPFEQPQFSTSQVMQLPLRPPCEPSKLHLLIRTGRWLEIKQNYSFKSKNSKTNATITRSLSMSLLKSSIPDPAAQLLLRDEYGRTPLFLILRRRVSLKAGLIKAPLDLIFEILNACPGAAAVPDIKNNFPLHMAVMNGHREDIVRAILQCYPGAVMEKNEDLDTPLILATNFSIGVQNEGPLCLSDGKNSLVKPSDSPRSHLYAKQDELNDSTYREVFSSSKRWNIVLLLLQYKPEAACIRNRHGMSVLEMALQRHAHSNIIRALLRADKTAVAVQHPLVPSSSRGLDEDFSDDISNRSGVITPLSLAVRRGAHEEVLGMLSCLYFDALGMRDEYGLTPLSSCWLQWLYAFSHNSGVGICDPHRQAALAKFFTTKKLDQELLSIWLKIKTLLCASQHLYSFDKKQTLPVHINDEKAKSQDGTTVGASSALLTNESYVVHAAAAQDCPVEVIDIAILLFPSQVKKQSFDGSIPLHLAAGAPVYVKQHYEHDQVSNPIDSLSKAYPSGALIFDGRGLLPIHIAIRIGKKWDEGISSLVMAEPRSLNVPDPLTGLFPSMLAAYCYFRRNPAASMILRKVQNRVGLLDWKTMTERQKEIMMSRLCKEEELSSITSLFELLRAAPNILSFERCQKYSDVDVKPSLTHSNCPPERINEGKASNKGMVKANEDELKLIYPSLNNFKLKAEINYPNTPINGVARKSVPKSWVQHQSFQNGRHLSAAEEEVDNRAYPQLDLSKVICILCKVHLRQSVLIPCRHLCLCSSCASLLTSRNCLVCGAKVTNIIDVLF